MTRNIVETKTHDFDQMLKDQAAAATHPAALAPLIALARQAGSRGTARALQKVQKALTKQLAGDEKRYARERAKLDRAAAKPAVYATPTVRRTASERTVQVENRWGEVVDAKPYPEARAQGKETTAVKNAFGQWVEVTVSSQGGRGARSSCTSEWGRAPDPRDYSIVPD